MNCCDQCQDLTSRRLRPDCPTRFECSYASDISTGLTRATYKCRECGTFWCWNPDDGWEHAVGVAMTASRPQSPPAALRA